jgi:hypothetical protein
VKNRIQTDYLQEDLETSRPMWFSHVKQTKKDRVLKKGNGIETKRKRSVKSQEQSE